MHQSTEMTDHGADDYELDAEGRRVLIGLTAEETEEFTRLDAMVFGTLPLSQHEWSRPEERRWLELYQKHEAARRPFLMSGKTRH
jgi:hypothetical protein